MPEGRSLIHEDKNNSTPEKVPVPEGSNPEYMRWETKVDASQREVGVTDPEGKYHALRNGQTFRIDRDRQQGRYLAIVTNPDGTEHIIREGSLGSKKVDSQDILDRERLNRIARAAADPKALFGREVVLDDADKEEINRLAIMAEPIVQDAIKRDPTWEKFQRSITDHPGLISFVFPPNWLTNGGLTEDDIKIRDTVSGGIEIVVPERTYNNYFWEYRIKQLMGPFIDDTSAHWLFTLLRDVRDFLKSSGKI